MLKRSCPRAITDAVTGNGNSVASTPFTLPVYSSASSRSWPRATVPGTGARADRSSLKNGASRSGMYFGWSCMSCRQDADASPTSTASSAAASRSPRPIVRGPIGNGRHLARTERLEELARVVELELRVARLDQQEEAVAARQREPRHVEHGVIRRRQPVECEHPEHGRQRGREDR